METLNPICKKRLIGDLRLIQKDPMEYLDAYPDETNLLIWHFVVKGPSFSDFNGGYYLGKIMHNPEYPFKAPDFMMLTPNGRFMDNKKICLSNSGYHSSEWSAMWNVKSILTGFLSIMLDDKEHGISHIHESKTVRTKLALDSISYNKKYHMDIIKKFTRFFDDKGDPLTPTNNSTSNDNQNNNNHTVINNQNNNIVNNQNNNNIVDNQNNNNIIDNQNNNNIVDNQNNNNIVDNQNNNNIIDNQNNQQNNNIVDNQNDQQNIDVVMPPKPKPKPKTGYKRVKKIPIKKDIPIKLNKIPKKTVKKRAKKIV